MSKVAEASAVARQSAPMTPTETGGFDAAAKPSASPSSNTCVIRIQPRLRPRNGRG